MKTCLLLCRLDRSGTPSRRLTSLLHHKIVKPACSTLGYKVFLGEGLVNARTLQRGVPRILTSSELVIADVTSRNQKVLRDLEIRRVSGKPTLVLVREGARLPSNIAPYSVLIYQLDTPADRLTAQQLLTERLRTLVEYEAEVMHEPVSGPAERYCLTEEAIGNPAHEQLRIEARSHAVPTGRIARLPATYDLGYELPSSRNIVVSKRLYRNPSACEYVGRSRRSSKKTSGITLRIFLASSAELRDDRDQLDLYLRQQNDLFRKEGLYLEIVRWENFLDAMADTRLQDEYNREVRACDIFVSLFFTKAGLFTEEELDTAHQHYQQTGRPFIYTFFKNAPRNTGDIGDEILSLLQLKRRLRALGHYPTSYDSAEHLKRQFIDQLKKILHGRRVVARKI